MRIGVIGIGVIAVSMVKALEKKYGEEAEIYLSPRNAARAEALRAAYSNVMVTASNQEVLDKAEWVILSVLPNVAREVISSLSFRKDHRVISVISEPKMDDLERWIGPCESITRVLPLDFIERHTGPVVVFPDNRDALSLLEGMGEAIAVDSEDAFKLAQAVSSAMGPFYYLVDQLVEWAAGQGMARRLAAPYLLSMFKALSEQGELTDPEELASLWKVMTPGGLNEGAIRTIRDGGGFDCWLRAMEGVRKRMG